MTGHAGVTLAFDLGGTLLRCAVIRDGVVKARWSVATPRDLESIITTITEHIHRAQLQTGGPIDAIGVSALGPVLPGVGVIRNAPTLPGFDNVPLQRLIESQVHQPVLVVNDANAATYGEWKLGVGKGTQDFCFVTVSTGIGAGFIANGNLFQGHRGAAGELGRFRIRLPGKQQTQLLESCASGTAIAAQASRIADETQHAGLLRAREELNGPITAKTVASLADAGDEVCRALLSNAAVLIGETLANITRLFDPEVIAIGGGVSRAGRSFWEPMIETMTTSLVEDGSHLPRVAMGELQDDAGLRGVALLTHEHLTSGVPA